MLAGRVSSFAALLVTAWGAPLRAPPGPVPVLAPGAEASEDGAAPEPRAAPEPGAAPEPEAAPVAAAPELAASTIAAAALDFVAQARALSRVTACAPGPQVPARFDSAAIEAHCKTLTSLIDQWSVHWLARARPFFAQIVPAADLPDRVVYPFGGGDLLTALVVFPNATEITTLSLEPAGDPRVLESLQPADLPAALLEVRKKVNHIFAIGHSKTTDMRHLPDSKLPGDLTYALVALALNDLDVMSVRYFRVGATGELQYVTEADLHAAAAAGTGAALGRRSPFANLEIEFQARGGGPRRVFRHLAVNLDDTHMQADPAVLRHLEAKGRISAMTKAASYLLWWKEFSTIRNYLLRNMVWMVSDSTGIPTEQATAAGFEQIPFGHFDGPFLGGGNRPTEDFKKLWAAGAAPLTFRFGYPDSAGHDHLLITRRATQK